jgi:hypothetical protein
MTDEQTPGPAHAGQHLVGKHVKFELRDSDQATTFNRDRWDEEPTGPVLVAYDSYVVVRVPGWQFAHTVRADRCTPVDVEGAK